MLRQQAPAVKLTAFFFVGLTQNRSGGVAAALPGQFCVSPILFN
jgi:hypothetical protein